jgi:membrane-associated phospholipid phosphatase
MFETEVVHWLQSFASDGLTWALVLVSDLGERRLFLGVALLVAFGLDLRVGIGLVQILLWNDILTDVLKHTFALPRPAEVDATVELLGGEEPNAAPFVRADGDGFFDLPEPEAIEHFRLQSDNYGFPSGHVSRATALGVGSWLLLKSRTVGVIAAAFVFMTAISRMYLGRHFLADVLGGLGLGLLIVGATHIVFRREFAARSLEHHQPYAAAAARRLLLLALVASMIPLLLVWLTASDAYGAAGRLAGANLAVAVLLIGGLPAARRGAAAALVRIVTVLLLYIVSTEAVQLLTGGPGSGGTAEFVAGALPPVIYLIGAVWLLTWVGLYRTRPALLAADRPAARGS